MDMIYNICKLLFTWYWYCPLHDW